MTLNYKTFGQGQPLIILHGLLGSLDNWQTIGKELSENYTVFIVDQRNHGKSPHSDNFNYDLLSEDLYEFMDEHFISSAHILGHSMGGKTAMYFAMKYPEKIDKLIIADIAPVQYEEGHNEIFEALFSIDLSQEDNRNEIDDKLKLKIPNYGVRQFLMKGLTRNDDKELAWKFNVKAIWENYKEILKTFDTDAHFDNETLFIKGQNSDYILDEYKNDILKYFPKAKFATIEGVGHWLHAEKPKEFFELVDEFLEA